MTTQDLLLQSIRKKIGTRSLHDVLSERLAISYDAAHRRISGKSKLTLEEALALSQYFSIPLDQLQAKSGLLHCKKSVSVTSQTELALYIQQAVSDLQAFQTIGTFYYSAKDIPLFYTLGGTLLTKFKWYVWLNLLAKPENSTPFNQFYLTASIAEQAQHLQQIYTKATVHELWNDSTLNSTLFQIDYYYESGLLQSDEALLLLTDLMQLIHKIERKLNEESHYFLYYHELLLMNNNVLVENDATRKLFVPYTMISYLVTEDDLTLVEAKTYFQRLLQNAKCLNTSGPKDRLQFFAKKKQRIQFYLQKIKESIQE
jgi:hypothetical protein